MICIFSTNRLSINVLEVLRGSPPQASLHNASACLSQWLNRAILMLQRSYSISIGYVMPHPVSLLICYVYSDHMVCEQEDEDGRINGYYESHLGICKGKRTTSIRIRSCGAAVCCAVACCMINCVVNIFIYSTRHGQAQRMQAINHSIPSIWVSRLFPARSAQPLRPLASECVRCYTFCNANALSLPNALAYL